MPNHQSVDLLYLAHYLLIRDFTTYFLLNSPHLMTYCLHMRRCYISNLNCSSIFLHLQGCISIHWVFLMINVLILVFLPRINFWFLDLNLFHITRLQYLSIIWLIQPRILYLLPIWTLKHLTIIILFSI